MVAYRREAHGAQIAAGRSRSDFDSNGVNENARPILYRHRLRISVHLLALHKSLRQALGERFMDYVVAGVASLCLFIYLIYALLRPERF